MYVTEVWIHGSVKFFSTKNWSSIESRFCLRLIFLRFAGFKVVIEDLFILFMKFEFTAMVILAVLLFCTLRQMAIKRAVRYPQYQHSSTFLPDHTASHKRRL
jgi:hypothetical protein